MNMDEYFVLFREYMLVQKPSSVNTRDSYLRDVSAFLRYLEGENITSPLEVETETVEAYVQHLHSLNRTNSTPPVRLFLSSRESVKTEEFFTYISCVLCIQTQRNAKKS